jgi:hypothetical protein
MERWIFPMERWKNPLKKSEMLPFPSDFFRASDGNCFFSEQAMEIAVGRPAEL